MITVDTILAAEHDHAGGPCFLGIDIGIRRDLFVIVVLELVGDVYWVRQIVAEARISFEAQDAHLARIMQTYEIKSCAPAMRLNRKLGKKQGHVTN